MKIHSRYKRLLDEMNYFDDAINAVLTLSFDKERKKNFSREEFFRML